MASEHGDSERVLPSGEGRARNLCEATARTVHGVGRHVPPAVVRAIEKKLHVVELGDGERDRLEPVRI